MGALQSHAQEAPPAAQPSLSSSRAHGGRGALGSESHELCDKTQGRGAPSASSFAGEDAQTLRPRPQELGVGNSFAPFCDSDGRTITSGSRRLGPPLARQRRHGRHVATQRLAKWSSAVHDQVEAAAIGWVDMRGGRACQPLLRDDLALGSNSLARDAHPCMLEGLGSAGQQSGSRAGGVVVAVGVDSGSATVPVGATSVWSDRQRQPQPPPQGYEHAVGRQSGASLARDGTEPRGCVRSGLRTQHGLCKGLQGRQQLGFAKVGRAGLKLKISGRSERRSPILGAWWFWLPCWRLLCDGWWKQPGVQCQQLRSSQRGAARRPRTRS